METNTLPLTTDNLPQRLATVFRALRTGRHICRDDGPDYRDLNNNEEQYRILFQALGYELVYHGQGFYYFKGRNQLTAQRLQAVTLFMLILFQDLEDKKFQQADRAWERKLLSKIFKIAELPHFETSQRRSMLFDVGVTPETLQEKVLRPLGRLGMLEMVGSGQFRFRSPVYRFVDLCMQFAETDWEPLLAQNSDESQSRSLPPNTQANYSAGTDHEEEETAS